MNQKSRTTIENCNMQIAALRKKRNPDTEKINMLRHKILMTKHKSQVRTRLPEKIYKDQFIHDTF